MGIRTSQLTENTTLNALDLLYGVDVSDLTHSPDGTSKKIKLSTLISFLETNIDSLDIGSFDATAIVTEAEGIRDNDNDTTLPTSGAVVDAIDKGILYGMNRQAIINGNFEVWQRALSVTYTTDIANTYLADRWSLYIGKDGGTLPTVVESRQPMTAGELDGSFFYHRLNTNGAGSSLGLISQCNLQQPIEHGTKKLCGLNKKVTVSFYARSSILGKKLGVCLQQRYGTGGSPSATETINGAFWTLTSDWTKYSFTFTTNTLTGKTFGTEDDDVLSLMFYMMWGSSVASRVGDTVAESFVGSGNVDITQVQVTAGEDVLPFCVKSFREELRDCQRYYIKWANATGYSPHVGIGQVFSATQARCFIGLPTTMRKAPTLETSGEIRIFCGGGNQRIVSVFGNPSGGVYMPSTKIDVTFATSATDGGAVGLFCSASGSYLALNAEL